MAVIKCKMCGGTLAITEGSTIAQCEYCGRVQTIPALDDEKKLIQFERAERLRKQCAFDKAAGIYETIVADYRQEAEAYWGLVLCKFGIEYVDDPATGKKIPTCHRSSFNSVMEDADFEQVLENADATARKVYREEAKQIEALRKDILEVSKNEEPYDIFICYKETDSDGERTLDSVLAQDIYDALTEKNYRVFFSRITLEDKLGQEYEPYIFAALNSAKVMLVIGTDYEHFNAVWVRNEWSRYLKLMETDKSKHLIPCFKGIDAYDIPKEFAKLQAQDLGKVGAIQDLLRGVDKLVSPTVAAPATNPGSNIVELLKMGNQGLETGEWTVASSRFDLALIADPKNAEAHLGRLLAERKCKKPADLSKTKKKLESSGHFNEALAYADDTLKKELLSYSKKVAKNNLIVKILVAVACFVALLAVCLGLNTYYNQLVWNFQHGHISPRDAYTQLWNMRWFKKDEGMLFLAAAGMGDNNTAKQYSSETLTLTPITAQYLYSGDNAPVTKTVKIFDGTTTVADMNLSQVVGLEEIIFPDGVTSIGESAFNGCSSLTSIAIPDSVTSIGESAFNGCSSLTSIAIPDGVTSIGESAFNGCSSLTSIAIPDGVTSIGGEAFKDCSSLTFIAIPDSVTYIGDFAFRDCSSLTSITIPSSVARMGFAAFHRCERLEKIYCEAENRPEGWVLTWDRYVDADKIVWGYKG